MFFSRNNDMKKQARLLDTVNTAATILLTSNEINSFEKTLFKSFALVGSCLDVDRVQIWCNETINNERHFILRHEWLSDYGKKCRQVPYGLNFPYSIKKGWEQLFLNGGHINSPLSELTEDDRDFWGYYEMKSIVMIPMYLEGDFWGLFSIHDCRRERTFMNEEISILTSAGLMMSTAVNRNLQTVKMRDAEERIQLMFDAAPLCAMFWDKNMKIIDCNQEAVKMFGMLSKQEFIENFNSLSPEYQPDGERSSSKGGRLVNMALVDGHSRFEWLHQKLDGEPIPAEVTCVRVKHKDEYTVIEYIRDLREQKAMITEMRKAEIAEESSKAKSDFLAKMSHEIRTPMNAILGITEIQLQNHLLGQDAKDALERIYNSADLLLGIINDILDLSKIEAGKLELSPTQYDIASLIHDTVQLNMMRYESKPIEFKLDVNKDVPLMLYGDELRIKQILNNLLSNAFKYTQEGSINFNVSSGFTHKQPRTSEGEALLCSEDDDTPDVMIIFSIDDTGQGMTEEQVRKLGSEYSRFNMEANRKTVGTGLGMNITRNLLQMMNGEIEIESTPGMGSKFTVRLPQRSLDDETIGKELADNLMQLNFAGAAKIRTIQLKHEYMPYGRVLIVDDVETNLYVAKGLMSPYGLSIDTAMTAFEAINKVRDGSVFDIIFMDHMMPGMDGIEAAKIIRDMGYKNPIVALTANALAGQAEMFMQNGFDDFISKPVDIRQLNKALNKFVRDKQPPEVLETANKQRDKLRERLKNPQIDPQLAEFFLRDAKKSASLMEAVYINKCRRSDDAAKFIINVHAMKSALANIGEMDLSAEAQMLEQAGREKNIDMIINELPSFMKKLYSVIHKFEAKDGLIDENSKDEGNLSVLKELLLEIKAACSIYNKKAAKDLLAQLRKKSWSDEIEERLGKIAGLLLHSDFDDASKLIEEYTKLF